MRRNGIHVCFQSHVCFMIPSVFPNLTGHFPPAVPPRRSENAKSANRLQNQACALEAQYTDFVNKDQLQNFSDLRSRIKSDSWAVEYTKE